MPLSPGYVPLVIVNPSNRVVESTIPTHLTAVCVVPASMMLLSIPSPTNDTPSGMKIGNVSPSAPLYVPAATFNVFPVPTIWLSAYVIVFHGLVWLPVPVVLLPLVAFT